MTTSDMVSTPVSPSAAGLQDILKSFVFRVLLLSAVTAAFMVASHVNIGSIGQGLAYSLVGVAVYVTFRLLDFPDLSVDGSFPIGGAICATLIVSGTQAEFTLFAAFVAGALTGLVTALIHVWFKINGLLASIIVLTGAYTITLRIMDSRSNVPLLGEPTILAPYVQPVRTWLIDNYGDDMRRHATNLVEITVFGIIVLMVLLILNWFLHTELGLTIRAVGRNSQMVRTLGFNHQYMIILALMVSNGLAGLAGALAVQQLGFADVSLGIGVIIRGLAAVMIGEVLLRPRTVGQGIFAAAGGMLIFEISRAWVFSTFDLPASDVRMVSALVVLAALASPNLIDRWQQWRLRSARRRNGHA